MTEEVAEEGAPADERSRRVRWPFVVAGVLAVVLAIGAYLWFERVPRYRPELGAGERYGIDVSNHQGSIDWARVADDDIDVAYLKATEGGDWVDERFAENWRGAADAGLARGAYHFFTLCRPGADQADNFLRTVPRDADALAPVVDLELGGNCAGRPAPEDFHRELRTFVDRVEAATGQQVVLYVLDDVEDLYHVRAVYDRPTWVRRLLQRPDEDDWLVWQVSEDAAVAGIDGPVDLDVVRPR